MTKGDKSDHKKVTGLAGLLRGKMKGNHSFNTLVL